jgi:TetR/AcrR family transcriptional regulator, transcriptional repressor for nem operon
MKVSREQAAENRARVIEVAGRLFREKGFDGVGVADIMKGAGLTHGGFYGQFASKDDLAIKACAQTLDRSVARWTRLAASDDPLAAIVTSYRAEPSKRARQRLRDVGAVCRRGAPTRRRARRIHAGAAISCRHPDEACTRRVSRGAAPQGAGHDGGARRRGDSLARGE